MSRKEIERQRSRSQEESVPGNWEGAAGRYAKCTGGSGKVKGERSSWSLETKRALAFSAKTASSGRSGTETRGQ